MERDPAARSHAEVLLCYAGLHAIWSHRVANRLWSAGHRLSARVLSHATRIVTGVDIHPGATIGDGFFIDHGMGVVIGETTVIGKDVTLYQGVTLGGTSWRREKRHPTLGDRVVVGAGATVLGPCTIGHDSKVGSGSVVVQNVPAQSTVIGVPGRIVAKTEGPVSTIDLDHTSLPDPEAQAIELLRAQVADLHKELEQVEKSISHRQRGNHADRARTK